MASRQKQEGPTPIPEIHHAFHQLITDSPQIIAFLYGRHFTTTLKETAENAAEDYGVTPDQAVEEFRRLLALKIFSNDSDGRKIGATPLMNYMWREAFIKQSFYQEIRVALCFDPQYQRANRERVVMTEFLYRQFFNSAPLASGVVPSWSV